MKKITKATIATTAGVILLLGGGGTFATWNDSASAGAAATITAGNLDVVASEPGVWSANGTPITNIATYAIAPGDVLTYTKPMTIVAEGDNMRGTVGLSSTSIRPATPDRPADEALVADLLANATLEAKGIGIMSAGQTFKGAAGTAGIEQDVTVTVTITFPKDGQNDTMTGAVILDDFTVTLTQTTI